MIFAPVKEVVVYRDSAVVRRRAAVSLRGGTNEVILSGISDSADPDSLRLFFPAGIIGKDVQIIPYEEAVRRLPSAELDDEIAEAKSRINTLKTMEQLWVTNGNFATRGECSNETVVGYLEALPSHLENLRAQQKELAKQLDALEIRQEALKRKERFQAIRLVVEAAEACEAECRIEYSENAAEWNSTYEIHAASDANEISVISRARITQNTGEDWENVRISLYTGNPTEQQSVPVLKKLKLQFTPPVPKKIRRPDFPAPVFASSMAMGKASSDEITRNLSSQPQLSMEEAEETESEATTGYALPGTRTVISGSVGTVADIKTITVPVEMRIVCIPKLDDSAYLAAMVRTADWPLKSSSAQIYLNNNYRGEIRVDPYTAEETFMISFGKDERLGLKRETVRSTTEDVMLRGQKRKISEYLIQISNRQEKPLTVWVYDQIPVSSEKQITVDQVFLDNAFVDEETGKLRWRLTVEGKATVEKRLSYTVIYPKDKQLYEVQTAESGMGKFCPHCGYFGTGKYCHSCGNLM